MKLNVLIGTLIGITAVFILFGFLEKHFEWIIWIFTMAAGIGGHLVAARFQRKKQTKDQ